MSQNGGDPAKTRQANSGNHRDGLTTLAPSREQDGQTWRPADIRAYQAHVADIWVGRGYYLVPCSAKDKAAMVGGFGADATEDQLARFRDPATVRAWWTGRYRRAHVGILTGPSGLVVIDIDVKGAGPDGHTGEDTWRELLAAAGESEPVTYTVRTPSGGRHLYFQQPADGRIGCATGLSGAAALGEHIDVRGWGGYVIAAGSYARAQGVPYTRTSPDGVRPAPLPGWLLTALRAPLHPARPAPPTTTTARRTSIPAPGSRGERYVATAITTECERLAAMPPESGRNDQLFRAALKLGGLVAAGHVGEELVREALADAAWRCGLPPRAAERTIASGMTRAQNAPREVPA